MVDGVIPILGLSPEKQLRTFEQTVSGKTVQTEAVTNVDPTNADAVQAIDEIPKAARFILYDAAGNAISDSTAQALKTLPTDPTGADLAKNSFPESGYGQVTRPIQGMDYLTMVQAGLVPGHKIIRSLGEREGGSTTAGGEDIWRGNDLSPAPDSHVKIPLPASAGEQMSVVSESTNDVAGGTDAAVITIDYLDPSGDEQQTDVTLNGDTPVNLTPTDVRFVQDMHISALGSSNTTGVADGPIKIYQTADAGLVYSMIAAGGNQSLVPHKMVPNGKTLYMKTWTPSESQGKRTAVRLRADCTNDIPAVRQADVFLFKSTCYCNAFSPGAMPLAYTIPALSVVKASAFSDATGADTSVHWWGILVDD